MRNGLDLIKKAEGCKLKAYRCPVGVPTIGYGETRGVKMGMTITRQQAEEFLLDSYDEFEAGVRKLVSVDLTENQLGALTSFAYNLGLGNLKNSSLLRFLNQSRYNDAANQFLKWTRGGGKVLPGLVTRRAAERELFLKSA
jgi:lysozyme